MSLLLALIENQTVVIKKYYWRTPCTQVTYIIQALEFLSRYNIIKVYFVSLFHILIFWLFMYTNHNNKLNISNNNLVYLKLLLFLTESSCQFNLVYHKDGDSKMWKCKLVLNMKWSRRLWIIKSLTTADFCAMNMKS